MKQELDALLCQKYPYMFQDRDGPIHKTCMCWGFAHGDGWFNILDMLCSGIQAHINWKRDSRARDLRFNRRLEKAIKHNDYRYLINPKISNNEYHVEECKHIFVTQEFRVPTEKVERVVVEQVKEKFGTLRFYYRGGDDAVSGMVQMAELLSAVTCEECGKPGKLRGGSWVKTTCEEHAPENRDDESY